MRVREYETMQRSAPLENWPDTLTCPRCGFLSHNGNDVQQQYCGFCHLFLQDSAKLLVWTISPENDALRARLNAAYARSLPDGRALAVFPTEGQGALLRICYDGDPFPPKGTEAAWIYDRFAFAVNAAATWDPRKEREPYGWQWHAGRRRPHGNACQEYTHSS